MVMVHCFKAQQNPSTCFCRHWGEVNKADSELVVAQSYDFRDVGND